MSHPTMDDVNTSVLESTIAKAKNNTRRRLNSAGVQVLEEYWNQNPGVLPSIGKRHELTDKIKTIPGNNFYKVLNTTEWFKRRIAKVQAECTSTSQFPSLTKAVLEHLEVLLRSQPNPPSDVIQTWAALLSPRGATYQDVVKWVHLTDYNNNTASTRLPTPANTASPELSPSLPTSSLTNQAQSMKRDPMHSPMLPPLSIPSASRYAQQGSRYSPFTPISATSSTSPVPTPTRVSPAMTAQPNPLQQQQRQQQHERQQQQQQQPKNPRVPILQSIIRGVADAVSTSNTPPATVPSSAIEFNEMFAPYEKQMAQLMNALEHT